MLYMPPSNCKDKKSTSLTAGQIAFRYLTLIVALQMAKIKPMQLKSIAACLSVFFKTSFTLITLCIYHFKLHPPMAMRLIKQSREYL